MATVRIVNSLGTTALPQNSDIVMSAGFRTVYTVDKGERKVIVDTTVPATFREDFYNGIKDCAENHASSTLQNAGRDFPVDFTYPSTTEEGSGYYVSNINGAIPCRGAFAVVGGKGFRWAPSTGGLTVADISRPEVDVMDYMRIAGYVTRLEEVLNKLAEDLSGEPAQTMSATAKYGLYKQYQALREIWNYLVVRSMVIFEVQHQGMRLYVKARLTNALAVPVTAGSLSIGFIDGSYKAFFEEAYSFDGNDTKTVWSTSSSLLQPMATGSWLLSPPSTITVQPGDTLDLLATFVIVGSGTVALSSCGRISRFVAPWVDKPPAFAAGKVTSAGYLSWDRPHFNPQAYPTPVPAGLPPVGDGCTSKKSPGTVSYAWGDVSNVVSARPSIHITVACTADKTQASFLTDFTRTLKTGSTDIYGTYSISATATTVTLVWTPTTGTAVNIAVMTMTNRHFHKGDTITLDIPEGWGSSTSLERVKASCVWSVDTNGVIEGIPRAGGEIHWFVSGNPDVRFGHVTPVRLTDKVYQVDSIRSKQDS